MRNRPSAVICIAKPGIGAATLAIALLATGCASLPQTLPDIDEAATAARTEATADWNATPALRVRHLAMPAIRGWAGDLPEAVASREIDLVMPFDATISDFAAALGAMGLPTVIASEELAQAALGVTRFDGELGTILSGLSVTRGVAFSWAGGLLAIRPARPLTAYLPQNKALIETVAHELSRLGATEIVASMAAGSVSFDVTGANIRRVRHYLHRVVGNASTIALQVAIVTVGLSRKRSTGLDWSRLQVTLGRGLGLDNTRNNDFIDNGFGGDPDIGTGNSESGGSNVDAENSASVESSANVGVSLTGSTLGLVAESADFDLQALFSLLSTYGNTRTTQNLVLRTLSGSEVKIRSGATVPYISGVDVSTSDSGSLLGGTETETVETGLTLTIEPRYSDRTGLVTMVVNLKLKSIIGFLTLSAGDQVGSISRPQVQDRLLETVARAAAGQTVVLGGLIYDQISDNRNTLAGLEDQPIAYKAKQVQRNALFIVIRPTVITYEFADENSAKEGGDHEQA